MFTGSYDHVLDDKGRTSLPKEFRQEFAKLEGEPWLTALPHCLAIYPEGEFEALQTRLSPAGTLNASVQRVQRLITGMATRCPVDRQGRILIPAKSREWAKLQKELVFVGVGTHVEVWDRHQHELEMEKARADFEELTTLLSGSGK